MFVPGGGGRWLADEHADQPFKDVNVRKAVIAGFDRDALRLARGGTSVGASRRISSRRASPGFDEAGGMKGPGYDFMANPSGDATSPPSTSRAGMSSGKYEGGQRS